MDIVANTTLDVNLSNIIIPDTNTTTNIELSVKKLVLECLHYSAKNSVSMEYLANFLLIRAMDLCQSDKGYMATSDPLNEANMQYTCVKNVKLSVGDPFLYSKGRTLYIPPSAKKNWMFFTLLYHNKMCGVVGLNNNTGLPSEEVRNLINPFLPLCVSTTIGGHLLSREVQSSHDLFLSTMSHEIRTPLNGIVAGSRLLREYGELTPDQSESLNIISACSFQLVDIINDILDFTKIRCGRMKLEPTAFDLRSMVDEAYDVISFKVQEKKLNVWFDVNSEIPSLLVGDKKRIRQILLNLLGNAVKFTESGSITVRIYMGEIMVATQNQKNEQDININQTIHDTQNKVQIHIEVEDSGIGIPSKDFDTIFEPFRISTSSGNAYNHQEGTGLGLAICRNLSRAMGGDISILRSVVGHGTCMHVYVQMEYPPSHVLKMEEKSLMNSVMVDKNVLVVHPDTRVRIRLGSMLRELKIKPLLCGTIEEMEIYLESGGLHVIMAYVDMDGMNQFIKDNKPVVPLIGIIHTPSTMVPKAMYNYTYSMTEGSETLQYTLLSAMSIKKTVSPKTISKSNIKRLDTNILIVEDNAYNMAVIQRMLNKFGYEKRHIDEARNGLQAVQKASEKLYDLILMDLKMPIMNGHDASKQILALYKSRCPPSLKKEYDKLEYLRPTIVAMTACVMDSDRTQCLKAGMKAFLSKPLVMEEVEVMLDLVLKKRNESKKI